VRNEKVETEKGHEIVGRLLLERIRSGELKPGQKLPSVVQLSESFGVGRSTMREALSALKAMGWLDIRHGGGTFVKRELPSDKPRGAADLFREAESVRELLEVRKVIETGTASLAAMRRSGEQLVRLESILARMERALEEDDTSSGERADVDFHVSLASASGNSLLIQLMDQLTQRMSETIGQTRELWFYQERSTAARLLDEHRAIFEAVRDREADRAAALMNEHLNKVGKVLNGASPA